MLGLPHEIDAILRAWKLDPSYEALRSSWHNVLKTSDRGEAFYLRITPSLRDPAEIRAEIDWMVDLLKHRIPVVRVRTLPSGEMQQNCHLQAGPVTVACFAEALGRLTQKRLDFRAPVIKNWAKLLGQLHDHARIYISPHPEARRPRWDEDAVLKIALDEARQSGEPEAQPFLELIRHFQKVATPEKIILTHADLHFGNLSITPDDSLTAFDFDDACYHFPEHDVAVALISIRKAAWENLGLFKPELLEKLFLETYARPTADLNLWSAYRIGVSYFWALGSARQGAFDEERLAWLKNSTPWWKTQFKELLPAVSL